MSTKHHPALPSALVVDDDPGCRDLVTTVLREQGFEVTSAKDGFQAILALHRRGQGLALLITDTEMPGVHGWEVIRCARHKAPRTRVLRLGRPEDGVPGPEYRLLQRVPVLRKPFGQADLIATLRTKLQWPMARGRRRDTP